MEIDLNYTDGEDLLITVGQLKLNFVILDVLKTEINELYKACV